MADTDGFWRSGPLIVLAGLATLQSFIHALLPGGSPLAWLPVSDVVVRTGICPPTPESGGLPVASRITVENTSDPVALLAVACVALACVLALGNPARAGHLAQLGVVLASAAAALHAEPWLKAALTSGGYSEVMSCDFDSVDVVNWAGQENYFRALMVATTATVVVSAFAALETPTMSCRRRAPRLAVIGLVTLGALPTVLWSYASLGLTGGRNGLVALTSLTLTYTTVIGLLRFSAEPRLARVGSAAVLTGLGLSFAGFLSFELIRRENGEVISLGPADARVRSTLAPEAAAAVDFGQGFFIVFAVMLAWTALLSSALRRVRRWGRPDGVEPVVLLCNRKGTGAGWVRLQRWAWSRGWHTTVSRTHARGLIDDGARVLYLDVSDRRSFRGDEVGEMRPGRAADPADMRRNPYRQVGRPEAGEPDLDQLATAVEELHRAGPDPADR